MNRIFGLLLLLLIMGSCATYAQNSLTYISTDKVNSSSINIIHIDEFIQIINENNIKTVFYSDSQFIVQGNSLVYTIDKKGYKDLNSYKLGNNNFSDGESYYLAQEVGLNGQEEVDYYRSEAFLTVNDYKDALRLGFVRKGFNMQRNIHGIISKENMQNSIRYANIAVYLRYYYNWPQQNPYGRRQVQQNVNVELIGNTDLDYLAGTSNGTIRKLTNYNYYIINIPIIEKESFLYYVCKFAQFEGFEDYKNITGIYSVKNTDSILKQLGFRTLDDLIRADNSGIDNSNDYYLTVNYKITKNNLEANSPLIREIENTKQRYSIESVQYAMMLNYILKQPKGIPFSIRTVINKFVQEFRNNAIFNAFGYPNEAIFGQMFTDIPQLDKVIMYNAEGESLYVK